MKKNVITLFALVAMATTAFASQKDENLPVTKEAVEELPVGDCYGSFTITDAKGNFVAKRTLEIKTATAKDCYDALAGEYNDIAAKYPSDHKISFGSSYE